MIKRTKYSLSLFVITLVSAFMFLQCKKLVTYNYSKSFQLTTPGTLNTVLTSVDKSKISTLILSGPINALDFIVMRDSMPKLTIIDLRNTTIQAYRGIIKNKDTVLYRYNGNCIPENALVGKTSL